MPDPAPVTSTTLSSKSLMSMRSSSSRSFGSGEELGRCLRDQFALVACTGQVDRGGLTRAVTACDGCRPVRRTADDLIDAHLTLVAVRQADDRHAEVQQD